MKGLMMSGKPDRPKGLPIRKHPAHGVLYVEGQPTVIFDTVCTRNRKPWLANEDVHALLQEVWRDADAWLMGRYMIMPDHIHFFVGATESPIEYDSWVQYWKSQFSKRHKRPECRWLTDHWDTRMRSEKQYEEKWLYVVYNPVRHGLVARPEDWPYHGEIYELRWS
jgi:putative transposase